MSKIVPFESSALPANLAALFGGFQGVDDLIQGASGGGFPSISIKGSKWAIVRQGEREVITNEDGDARGSIEVVILKGNPKFSKVFYAKAYVEGNDDQPDCKSGDGVKPDSDVLEPQASNCASCPNNVWGSKITPDGKKTKSCQDSRRLCVAPAGDLSDIMLLKVPPASLAGLADFGKELARKGVPYAAVVTKLSFDPEASSPKIVFKPVRYITEEDAIKLTEVLAEQEDKVLQITGEQASDFVRQDAPVTPAEKTAAVSQAGAVDYSAMVAEATKPAAEKAAEEKPKTTRTKKAEPEVKQEAKPEPEVKKEVKAVEGGDLDSALDALMEDFDD